MEKRVLERLTICMLVLSFIFVGCATIHKNQARNTEDLLIAAGFTQKIATTPEGQAKLNALTPLKLVRATKDGKVIYVYPDPYNCKCAYVGGEREYAEYKRLAIQQNIALENLTAAEMIPVPSADPGFWW
jgi:hypothetical protein